MPQIIFAPQAIYKIFRKLVQGYDPTGVEVDGFYVDRNIQIGALANMSLKYFMVGIGAETDGAGTVVDLTRDWFDANVKDNSIVAGQGYRGGLVTPIPIYATNPEGYDNDRRKKPLYPVNFYNYGNSDASKVIGVLSVVADGNGKYYDIPGVAFQVGCGLATGEGNWTPGGVPVVAPNVQLINEIGIFDDDDDLILYGVFSSQPKNNTLTLKLNNVGMLKTLDYQLVLLPTTSTTSTSSSSSSTSSSLSSSSSSLSSLSSVSSSSSSSSSSTTM